MISLLAQAATGTPAPEPDPFPEMERQLPPTAIPWPEWAWWALGGAILLVVLLLVALGIWIARRTKKEAPPTPLAIAQRELAALRGTVGSMDDYAFAVAVSDVLRRFISAQFSLRATAQTSPEFLASISQSSRFTDADRTLLATFLEQCDLRKFARMEAAQNEALLKAASDFVESAGK